ERVWAHGDVVFAVDLIGHLLALEREIAPDLLEKGAQLQFADVFAGVALGEGEVAFQHVLHVIDILRHAFQLGPVAAGQRKLELEARQDGAQVVADARKHGGTLLYLALDALTHEDEGRTRLTDLLGTARDEIRDLMALSEAFGSAG